VEKDMLLYLVAEQRRHHQGERFDRGFYNVRFCQRSYKYEGKYERELINDTIHKVEANGTEEMWFIALQSFLHLSFLVVNISAFGFL
jgi:hypothetical protein